MERLEFKPDIGVPMIRRSVDLTGDSSGPFSSLFDYKQEAADLEAQNEKKQSVQKKIMRTNALGEAFRLIAEGIGASVGATITPRNINPGILSAVNEYGKNDTEYMRRLEGLNTKKLALGQADLQYNLGKADRATETEQQRKFITDQAEKERGWKVQDEIKNLNDQYKMLAEKARIEGDAVKTDFWNKKALMTEQLNNEVAAYAGKKAVDMTQYTAGPSTVRQSKEDIAIKSPETGTTHYFKPEDITKAAYILQEGLTRFNQQIPKNVRLMLDGKKYEEAGLAIELQNNWSMIKYALPEFASALQQAQFQNMQSGGTGALTPGINTPITQPGQPATSGQTPTGELSPEENAALQQDLQGVLESNYSDYKITTELTKRIKQAYIAKGKDKPLSVINDEVVKLKADWKEYQKEIKALRDTTKVK